MPKGTRNEMKSESLVAQRLYILLSLTYRYDVELFDTAEMRNREWTRLHEWVKLHGLDSVMRQDEAAILHAKPGLLNDRQKLTASWLIEGATVLAWALKMRPKPGYDEMTEDMIEIARQTKFLKEIAADHELRAKDELIEYQMMVRTCLWRAREYDRGVKNQDLKHMIAHMTAIDLSGEHLAFIGNDLSVFGKTLDKLDAEELDSFHCCLTERYRGINWILAEDGEHYHDTNVDA